MQCDRKSELPERTCLLKKRERREKVFQEVGGPRRGEPVSLASKSFMSEASDTLEEEEGRDWDGSR